MRVSSLFLVLPLVLVLIGCGSCGDKSADKHGAEVKTVTVADGGPLVTLPYLASHPVSPEDRKRVGVTVHDRERAARGYNLFVPQPEFSALLVDARGDVVHRWSADVGRAERDARIARYGEMNALKFLGWEYVKLAPTGDLFAIVSHHALMKLDWASHVVWTVPMNAHHDVRIASNGDLYVLEGVKRVINNEGKKRLFVDDQITIVRPDGKIGRRISLYDIFAKDPEWGPRLHAAIEQRRLLFEPAASGPAPSAPSEPPPPGAFDKSAFWRNAEDAAKMQAAFEGRFDGTAEDFHWMASVALVDGVFECFHTNTVVPLEKHPRGLWAEGDLMLSFQALDLVAVIDPARQVFKWTWGPGVVRGQHTPSVLPNGNILVFDNGYPTRGSRVVEVDPTTKEIVWSYEPGPKSLFSFVEGGAQTLDNGNILITEATRGRAVEINREKDVVWEYFNSIKGDHRSGIYRMDRYPAAMIGRLLGDAGH